MIRNENEVISVRSHLKAYVSEDIRSIDVDVCGNGCGALLGSCYNMIRLYVVPPARRNVFALVVFVNQRVWNHMMNASAKPGKVVVDFNTGIILQCCKC